jgi:membrane associated rhomboid family serine protease
MFLHGGWLHLITNLWSLWIFGDNVEDRLGPLRYLALYVGCGLVAGLLHLATNPHSGVPTIGASGAIAGVMGAYFVLFPRAQIVTLVPVIIYPLFLRVPAVVYLGLWFAMQLLSGATTVAGTTTAGVAWWAHVGGFAAGVVLLLVFSGARARARRVEYLLLVWCWLAVCPASAGLGRAAGEQTAAAELVG